MAHQMTREEIDTLAATEAQSITAEAEAAAATAAAQAQASETTLAYGATGSCVQQLVDLLAVLGHASNSVIKGGPPILDESVLADVRAAQTELAVTEPEVTVPADIPIGVKGELVGNTTWNALYAAAGTKLVLVSSSAPASGSGAPSA